MFGAITTAAYSGGVGGSLIGVALLEYSGWRSVFLPPAGMSIVIAGSILPYMINFLLIYIQGWLLSACDLHLK